MLRSVFMGSLVWLSILWPASSWATTETHQPWDVASVQIREVQDAGAPVAQFANDCSSLPGNNNSTVGNLADLGDIVAVGQQIWKIITDNQPVVTTDVPTVQALPRDVQCWSDLSDWKNPLVKSYNVEYKNYLGMDVVNFRFRLQFTYGGGRNGVGQYIANATVIPAQLDVLWGYKFDAQVEVPNVVNVGTSDKPVAGMELNLKWDVKTVLKQSDSAVHFFVRGDGQVQVDQ